MTIEFVLYEVQKLKPSQFTPEQIIEWLNELDKRIITEIISNHELTDDEEAFYSAFAGYNNDTPITQQLLVPDPYSEIYRWSVFAQIDLHNMEMGKYNNSARLFHDAWNNFAAYWNREHLPIHKVTHISY